MLFAGLVLIDPSRAYAQCTNPASPAGRIEFFSSGSEKVHRYCDGDNWIPWAGRSMSGIPAPVFSSAGGGASTLPLLNDVDDGLSPNDGQVLTYNSATGYWIASDPSGGGGGGDSVWSVGAGNDIYFSSGSTPMVGIGKTDPTVALDVVGDINFTGTINDVSDRRLKDNITPLENSLVGILALHGYAFTMKDDPGSAIEYGLMAQDVQPVFPELVKTKPDGMMTLNYMGLFGPLVEAMKTQQAEIDALRAENEALDARLKNLESRDRNAP